MARDVPAVRQEGFEGGLTDGGGTKDEIDSD